MLNIRIYSEKIENPIIQASILLHYPSLFICFCWCCCFCFILFLGGFCVLTKIKADYIMAIVTQVGDVASCLNGAWYACIWKILCFDLKISSRGLTRRGGSCQQALSLWATRKKWRTRMACWYVFIYSCEILIL